MIPYFRHNLRKKLKAIGFLIFLGPLYLFAESVLYLHRKIIGYDSLNFKNDVVYRKGRYASVVNLLLLFALASLLIYIPYGLYSIIDIRHIDNPSEYIAEFIINGLHWFVFVFASLAILLEVDNLSKYIKLVGWPHWNQLKKMRYLRKLRDKNYSDILNLIVTPMLMLVFFLKAITVSLPQSSYFILIFFFLWSFFYSTYMPPAALFLSTSWENKMVLQSKIRMNGINPVASLLNRHDPVVKKLSFFGQTFIFRTFDPARWTESVRILMDICPVIVMDTRHVTEPVLTEADMIFSNELQYKTLFVVHEDRGHPVLDTFFADNPSMQVDYWRFSIQDHLFTESELIDLLHDIPRLKALVQPKTTATVCSPASASSSPPTTPAAPTSATNSGKNCPNSNK